MVSGRAIGGRAEKCDEGAFGVAGMNSPVPEPDGAPALVERAVAGPGDASVTVAVCTFRRPQELQRTLQGLWAQRGLTGTAVTVVVVDNDSQASARPVVESALPPSPWTLRYVVEPRPGVASARNRCLREAQTELIAFIDDDEVPEPFWLAALLETKKNTGSDAVFGPVISRFGTSSPSWMSGSTAHKRPNHRTGRVIGWEHARTGNVLLGRSLVRLAGGEFDNRFSTTGGEDSLFFARAAFAGAKLIWCEEAVVNEDVPASRMRLTWVLRRSFRGGQTWVRIRSNFTRAIWLPMALRGALSVLVALLMLPPALLVSRGAAVRQAQRVAGGLGKMSAWWADRAARKARLDHYLG